MKPFRVFKRIDSDFYVDIVGIDSDGFVIIITKDGTIGRMPLSLIESDYEFGGYLE